MNSARSESLVPKIKNMTLQTLGCQFGFDRGRRMSTQI